MIMILVVHSQFLEAPAFEFAAAIGADVGKQLQGAVPVTALALPALADDPGTTTRLNLRIQFFPARRHRPTVPNLGFKDHREGWNSLPEQHNEPGHGTDRESLPSFAGSVSPG